MQFALAGFEQADAPPLRERTGLRAWRDQIRMRDVFDVVEELFSHDPVCAACKVAIGRLSVAEREVIDGYFFQEEQVDAMAATRGCRRAPSTTRRSVPSAGSKTMMCSSARWSHCGAFVIALARST